MRIKEKGVVTEFSTAWVEYVRYNKNEQIKHLTEEIFEDEGTYTHRGRFCLAFMTMVDNEMRCFGDYEDKQIVYDMINKLAKNGMLDLEDYK